MLRSPAGFNRCCQCPVRRRQRSLRLHHACVIVTRVVITPHDHGARPLGRSFILSDAMSFSAILGVIGGCALSPVAREQQLASI
jgi:hypothetical protein